MHNRGHQKLYWEMKTYLFPDKGKDEFVHYGNILVGKSPSLHAFTHHYVIMLGGLKPKCSHEKENKMQWKWKVEGSVRRDNTYMTSAGAPGKWMHETVTA